jgi:predicted ABC-class ATPase
MLSDCKDYLSTRTQRYIGQQERLEAVISRLVDEMLNRNLKIVRDNDLASLLKNTEVVLDGAHRRERLETGKSTSNVQNLWQGVVNASDKHMLRQYENGDVIDAEFTVKG